MHRWAFALVVVMGPLFFEACGSSSFYYNCHAPDQIDATTRSEVTSESLKFIRAAFEGETLQAFDQLTEDAKKSISREQLENIIKGIKPSGPYENLRVERLMTVTGRGHMQQQISIADCNSGASQTENNVRVAISNVPEQAYALISAKGSRERWITTLWLIPSSGKWQIQSFQVTMATVGGKPIDEILAMARLANGQGHTLNAGVLYATAASLASLGPFYHTELEDAIQKEAQQISPPREFRGQPPFILQGASRTFSVVRLSSIAIGGNLYLVISQVVSPWKDSREIEQKNRSLIKVFARQFPEYSIIFSGLVAEASDREGSNGWRTALDNSAIKGL